MNPQEYEILAQRVQAGETAAAKALYKTIREEQGIINQLEKLGRELRSRRSILTKEDLFHDTMVVLFRKIDAHSLEDPSKLIQFVSRTLRNKGKEAYRQDQRFSTLDQPPLVKRLLEEMKQIADPVWQQLLQEVLSKLSVRCQELFRLHYWENQKPRDIARTEGHNNFQTISRKLYKCKEDFRKILDKHSGLKQFMESGLQS